MALDISTNYMNALRGHFLQVFQLNIKYISISNRTFHQSNKQSQSLIASQYRFAQLSGGPIHIGCRTWAWFHPHAASASCEPGLTHRNEQYSAA